MGIPLALFQEVWPRLPGWALLRESVTVSTQKSVFRQLRDEQRQRESKRKLLPMPAIAPEDLPEEAHYLVKSSRAAAMRSLLLWSSLLVVIIIAMALMERHFKP